MAVTVAESDVAKHVSPDDLWIVVNGHVYDMTAFAPEHPGGSEIIFEYAGRDASAAYNEIHAPSLIKKSLPGECQLGEIRLEDSNSNNVSLSPKSDDNPDLVTQAKAKKSLDDMINLDDFERAAHEALSPKAWAFLHSGTEDNITRDQNNKYLRKLWLNPAIMIDVRQANMRTRLFGCDLESPFYISPTGGALLGGAEGELTLARAAAAAGIIHCFATPSSYPHEEILEATPERAFFQLYVNKDRRLSEENLRQVLGSGKIKAVFVTADVPVISKREEDERVRSTQTMLLGGIGTKVPPTKKKRGGGLSRQSSSFIDPTLQWSDIYWLRSLVGNTPIVLKGVQRAADAKMAMDMGFDGIVISNHGGRALDTAPPAIITLLETRKTCPEVFSRLEVLIDGGFRRGVDIVKAICLGASAVGLGRPFQYALTYGQEGVEQAASILKDEIETAMRLCGIVDLRRDAHPDYVNTTRIDPFVPISGNTNGKSVESQKDEVATWRSKL